jgi:pimeloyl-ACP methyl ester carboxylesterase
MGYAEYGVPDGTPVIYLPGLHQSRLAARLMSAPCEDLGIRLVAVDRPGFGLSSGKEHRTIAGWPVDLTELLDHLAIADCAMLAYCAGSAYVLAAAEALPERVRRISIVAGMAPIAEGNGREGMSRANRLFWFIARTMPAMLRLYLRHTSDALAADPEATLDQVSASFAAPDRFTMSDDEHRAVIIAALQETFRDGVEGAYDDAVLLAQEWNVDIGSIGQDAVIWHGTADATLPEAMGHYLAETLPAARSTFLLGEGHVSILSHHRRKILELCV